MSQFIPRVALGPLVFTSGYAPKSIDGPKRDMWVLEHEIPGREGGIVEYLGSKQPTYRIQGFFAPLNDQFNGPAGAVLSGTSYVAVTPDAAAAYLFGLRGSGILLFQAESTWSQFSGYSVWYENNFFYIKSLTLAQEAGRGYPYYPYTIDLMQANIVTYGNSSGAAVYSGIASGAGGAGYLNQYVFVWENNNVMTKGEFINTLGVYVNSVASGSLRVAIYNSGAGSSGYVLAQSAAQPAASGWNYFPLNPGFQSVSGAYYWFALMSNAQSMSGLTILASNPGANGLAYQSGVSFNAGFPAVFTPGTFNGVSGFNLNMVMVP